MSTRGELYRKSKLSCMHKCASELDAAVHLLQLALEESSDAILGALRVTGWQDNRSHVDVAWVNFDLALDGHQLLLDAIALAFARPSLLLLLWLLWRAVHCLVMLRRRRGCAGT